MQENRITTSVKKLEKLTKKLDIDNSSRTRFKSPLRRIRSIPFPLDSQPHPPEIPQLLRISRLRIEQFLAKRIKSARKLSNSNHDPRPGEHLFFPRLSLISIIPLQSAQRRS